VVRELNTVSHAIEIATREWGLWLPRNPVKLVRRPQVPRGRTRRLQEGEELRLMLACDLGRTPLLKPLLVLALETAMRRGELLSLEWRHIDLNRCVAHLPLTKNGDSRDIPLSRRAVAILRVLIADERRDTVRVFPVTGNSVRLAFEHLRARAGMSDLHFHDLRHEAVTRLFEKGLNIAEVSAISGHKELRMLQRYTHLRAVDLVSRLG
jgi:integrase